MTRNHAVGQGYGPHPGQIPAPHKVKQAAGGIRKKDAPFVRFEGGEVAARTASRKAEPRSRKRICMVIPTCPVRFFPVLARCSLPVCA